MNGSRSRKQLRRSKRRNFEKMNSGEKSMTATEAETTRNAMDSKPSDSSTTREAEEIGGHPACQCRAETSGRANAKTGGKRTKLGYRPTCDRSSSILSGSHCRDAKCMVTRIDMRTIFATGERASGTRTTAKTSSATDRTLSL